MLKKEALLRMFVNYCDENFYDFRNSIGDPRTTNWKEASKWLSNNSKWQYPSAIVIRNSKRIVTSKITSIDCENKTFTTSSGSLYQITGLDASVREVPQEKVTFVFSQLGNIPYMPFTNNQAFTFDELDKELLISKMIAFIDRGKHMDRTSWIVKVDHDKKRFETQSGSIYQLI